MQASLGRLVDERERGQTVIASTDYLPVGSKHGRLTIISTFVEHGSASVMVARCDCGVEKKVRASHIKNGRTISCGCARTKHGQFVKKTNGSPTYGTWKSMIRRCTKPTDASYRKYGAKGITVCDRWMEFENFRADMGDRPPGTSIDRIDGTLGYSADNCRWATIEEQNRNRSISRMVTIDGETKTASEWAHSSGISTRCIYSRLDKKESGRGLLRPSRRGK
jgi:hypothetical protein